MLLVTRYDGSSQLLAGTRSMGKASVLDECVLEILKPMIGATATFEAGYGDKAKWSFDRLRVRARQPTELQRVLQCLLLALTSH